VNGTFEKGEERSAERAIGERERNGGAEVKKTGGAWSGISARSRSAHMLWPPTATHCRCHALH
jgi:hypothetical protein